MRLVAWNIAGAVRHTEERHNAAWRYLLDELDPDIALLQEAVPPERIDDRYAAMVSGVKYPGQIRRRVDWGSTILSRWPLEEYEHRDDMPWIRELWGCAVVARLPGPEPIWLATIHSCAGRIPREQFNDRLRPPTRRCHAKDVWEIEVLAEEMERLFVGSRFIAGGDLNSALAFDAAYKRDDSARLFSNLAEMGFVDLRPRFHGDEKQTFFQKGKGPYQLDHVYADAKTEATVTSWEVIREPAETLGLSDHAPIVIDLDLPVPG